MNVKISRTNDPFKKYWWVILVFSGVLGGWFCLPNSGVESNGGAGGERGFSSGAQSLDSASNPNGAPGGAVDLSMDNSGPYRKSDGGLTSSLYQAPGDAAASSSATVTAAAAKGDNLADALKSVAAKTSRSSAGDASGWGGERAQKGFVAPRANFRSLSGAGSMGGSVSTSFNAGGGAEGLTAFGSGKANTGVDFARGLGSGASADAPMKNATASMRSLNSAANNAIAAAGAKSNDLASAMGGRSFDGSGSRLTGSGTGRGSAPGDGAGPVALGGAGIYAKLDSAPMNLKANPEKLDHKTITPPAAAPVLPPKPSMMDMIMQMVITGLVGAVTKGLVEAII